MEKYLDCMENIEGTNETIGYKLLKMKEVGSYKSTTSSNNHSLSDSDNESFFHSTFSRTMRLLMAPSSSKKSRVENYDLTYAKQ